MTGATWRRRARVTALGLALFVGAAGCGEQGGPGTLVGRASGEALGAVVLEIEGVGIQGFSGRGSTRVYAGEVPNRADTHRVILVDAGGGELGFDITVDDTAMEGPIVTVIEAARTDNTTVLPSAVAVAVER